MYGKQDFFADATRQNATLCPTCKLSQPVPPENDELVTIAIHYHGLIMSWSRNRQQIPSQHEQGSL